MAAETAALCSTLLFVGLFVFVSADQKNIPAESGQNVTLTCGAPNNKNDSITVVKWSRADLGTKYVFFYRNGHFDQSNQHPSFKNRVELQDRQMKDGDVSVILKNVTINDTGTYECRVLQRGTQNDPIIIYLSVAPPPPPGQTRGYYGLIIGVSVFGLLLLLLAAVFLLCIKWDKKPQSVRTETDDAELQSDFKQGQI